jgi:predicted ATPase
VHSSTSPEILPQGTKRNAYDAWAEYNALAQEIYSIDEELELLDKKKQNFMDRWEIEHVHILEKREGLTIKRDLATGKRSLTYNDRTLWND